MTSKGGSGNLKRGNMKPDHTGMIPQAHGGYLKPSYVPPKGVVPPGLKAGLERDKASEKHVRVDVDASLEEIAVDLTMFTKSIIRKARRAGAVPDRATMDVLREFRQVTEAVNESRRSRGAVAQAEEFFGTLDARMAEISGRAGEPSPAASQPS